MPQHNDIFGFIFACSDDTEDECFEKGLFGGPQRLFQKNRALEIEAHATKVFLYNVSSKVLRGPFMAMSRAGTFDHLAWGGQFRCQVRVDVSQAGTVPSITVPFARAGDSTRASSASRGTTSSRP